MNDILLTILTPSITTRTKRLGKLLRKLAAQVDGQPVELLCWVDNMVRSVGRKRDDLIQAAQGEYLMFVDDDDNVPDHYVTTALRYISENPGTDVFAIQQECYYEGVGPYYVDFSINYVDEEFNRTAIGARTKRFISHSCIWRTSLAQKVNVPSIGYYEDIEWAKAAAELVEKQVEIPEVMHLYEYDSLVSEGHDRDG